MLKINHAILHVFDFVSCENVIATEEIDLGGKNARQYVRSIATKTLTNVDNKRGEFTPDSFFAGELRQYFRGERDFVGLSQQIAEFLVGELGHMEKTPSTDLLVIDFEDEPKLGVVDGEGAEGVAAFDGPTNRYFAVVLLEAKQAYLHEIGMGNTGGANEINRHFAILPNPSQKVTSYAVINLRTMEVQLVDKMRVIAGEQRYLIPDGLLQCSTQASSREVVEAVTEIAEAVAEEYCANPTLAQARAKDYVTRATEDDDWIDLDDMGADVFGEDPDMARRFDEMAAEREMPERVNVRKDAVRRVAKSQRIVTSTGISITFPSEYGRNPELINFVTDEEGLITIELRNIEHIENR